MDMAVHSNNPASYLARMGQPPLRGAEDAAIKLAQQILRSRLRAPGTQLETVQAAKDWFSVHLTGRDREVFTVMYLDARHCMIESVEMFQGTLSQTNVYPREVVRTALLLNAAAIFLAHNHPSGDPTASRADELLTKTITSACSLVDVRVLDHFIVGASEVVSLAEQGLM